MTTYTLADATAAEERSLHARAAIQLAIAKSLPGDPNQIPDVFAARMGYWGRQEVASWRSKAAIAPLDTTGGIAPSSPYRLALAAAVDRVSSFGALKQAGAVQIPPNVTGALQAGTATASWTAEGSAKPVSALAFSAATFPGRKLTTLQVFSRELLFLVDPRTQDLVTRCLVSAIAAARDDAAFDATAASTSRPAGLLNGVSATTLSGSIAEQAALVVDAVSGGAATAIIVSLATALRLAGTVRDLDTIGVRVIISPSATNRIIGTDASGLLYVDGGVDLAVSEQADVQMVDSPSEPDTASTVRVSLFQRDLISIRAEQSVNWRARAGAVAWGTVV